MKPFVQIAIASSLFFAAIVGDRCERTQSAHQPEIVLAAIVKNIGKDPGVSSGYYVIYQLAKYRVIQVCAGTYSQKEIVVDHLLVTGDELKSLRIEDRVYLTLQPSKTIEMRFDEEGFRNSSDNVGTFYIGHKPSVTKPAQCKDVN